MNSDKFVSTIKNNNFNKLSSVDDNNFFINPESSVVPHSTEPIRHINDYDFNILKEDAYKDVQDELFKLEYKIAHVEEEIANLNNKIQVAKDIHDFITAEALMKEKSVLEEDLKALAEIYNDKSLSAKISSGLINKLKERISKAKKAVNNISDSIISHLPGKFASFVEIKNSINKLENINKSVDELMALRTPYGEFGDKYEQLSKYILKANSIQSEISKFFK